MFGLTAAEGPVGDGGGWTGGAGPGRSECLRLVGAPEREGVWGGRGCPG